MGKEKKSSEGNPPRAKDNSIVRKRRKLRTTTTLINNNAAQSNGLRNLVASRNSIGPHEQYQNGTTCNQWGQSKRISKNNKAQEVDKIVNEKQSISNVEDVMEWEPTEKEVIDTLLEMRRVFSASTTYSCIASSTQNFDESSKAAVHIVIDTNIFLSHLPIVKMLIENKEFCFKVQILVPWMVLQELDFMKTNKQKKVNLEMVARKAATFILEQINKKNSFFRSQTLSEFKSCISLLPDENADDKILQWCLYLKKEMMSNIILLSNDILFCAKASANGIQPMQSTNFIKLLRQILVAQTTRGSGQDQNNFVQDKEDTNAETSGRSVSDCQKPYKKKEDARDTSASIFLLQFEECILGSLSQLLEYEMKQVYEDIWHQIVLIKPPWNLTGLLRCIDKHWIAVFGYIYPRDMREKLEHLSNMWKKIKTKNTVEQEEREAVVHSGLCILQFIQRTRKQLHDILQKAIDGIKGLLEQDTELNDAFILDLFTRVWDRFNFICGTLSDAVGLHHHGLQYQPGSTVPTLQEITDGLKKLRPLLLKTESAMNSFFQNGEDSPMFQSTPRLENSLLEISNCILLSVAELGLQLRETGTAANSLTRALSHFVSDVQHRKRMENGLNQLRIYIGVLHSVALKLH